MGQEKISSKKKDEKETPEQTGSVKILNDEYLYINKDDGTRRFTNFVINPYYKITDELGFKTYLIKIRSAGRDDGPYYFDSSDWKSQYNFREWLGKCSGRYAYEGGGRELIHMIKYFFANSPTRRIKVIDGNGNTDTDLW